MKLLRASDDRTLFSRFPKQRPELPEAYRKIYIEHYKRNREGAAAASSLAQKMESWMHRKVSEDLRTLTGAITTLEIGAGNLNHLPYEGPSAAYDIVEPLTHLAENSPYRTRVRDVYADLREIRDRRYDRIISIAAFEHYCDLPDVVRRSAALLAPAGQMRIAVPSEGTVLWKLGYTLTTGLEFWFKYRLDYGVLMRHEHVNTAAEIGDILRAHFKIVGVSVLGISRGLSFYQLFECRSPIEESS